MPERFRTTKGQRGFTLAEILVTTAIFAIIMIAALTVYDRSNRVFSSSTEAASLQQSTRIGFDKLVSDLRMAGFDYNRGGIPTGTGQYPQPDEQIEYAGATAVVFRGNFDYQTQAARANGLATPNYTPMNASGGPIFPYITTDNTEIVAYVLRSTAPNAANTGSISFYADTDIPRRGYPNVAGVTSLGHAENTVTISGIDLTNDNPPYTLYRVTVDDIRNNRAGTPVAENIRSLQFSYYSDGIGSTLLKDFANNAITQTRNAGGTTIATANTGAIGGDGQYDPNASSGAGAGTFEDRIQRSMIQSVRVSLVGMSANKTPNYQNPDEANPLFKEYREYNLSSLVVPRNLGLQGFPEPSYEPPGPPTITGACVGHCGAPFITWAPPTTGGPVTVGYELQWDTNPGGAFAAPNTLTINNASATSVIAKDSGLDPSQIIYYRIVAINDNGHGQPSQNYPVSPKNTTRPSPPAGPASASTGQNNQITLSWVSPTTNATTVMQCNGVGASASGTNIPAQEQIRYQIYRGTIPNFNPLTEGVKVLDTDTASQPALVITPGDPVTWVDAASSGAVQSLAPPAACVQYYYRIRALDRCYKSTAMNYSGNASDSISDWFPLFGQNGLPGMAASSSTPSTPLGLILDPDPSKTVCPKANATQCDIALQWNKVATDTNNAPIAVDVYTVYRERRIQGTTIWTPDTTFGPAGMKDFSGFSSQAGSLISWIDVDALYADAILGVWEYRYSVSAKVCGTSSPAFSNTATYPGCQFGVAVTASGASAGSGTSADPWILGYNDSVTVTRTSGNQIASLTFDLLYNGVSVIGGPTPSQAGPGPFTYPWTDQSGSGTYVLWIHMIDSTGCAMTYVRFISQQPQAPCTFLPYGSAGRPSAPPTPSLGASGSQPRSVTFGFAYSLTSTTNFAVTNDQTTEALKLSIPTGSTGGPFTGSMTIVWADVNGLHPELTFVSADWSRVDNVSGSALTTVTGLGTSQALAFTTLTSAITTTQTTLPVTLATALGAVNSTGTLYIDSEAMRYTVTNASTLTVTRGANNTTAATHASAAEVEKVMTTTISAPANFPDIANGQSLAFTLHFTYDSSHKNSKLTTGSASAIQKICINYKVLSDPTRPQFCNLAGQVASTANPVSCD